MYIQVLLPKDISEMVKGNLRMGLSSSAMGLSSCPMVEGLLQSSLLRECCITAVPVEWYQERGRGGQQDLSHFHQRYIPKYMCSVELLKWFVHKLLTCWGLTEDTWKVACSVLS